MKSKRFFLTVFVVSVFFVSSFSGKYTILQMNKSATVINGRSLKVGDIITSEDLNAIKWDSVTYIKVRNEETKRTHVFTKRNIKEKETPSLGEYLFKKKNLMTREYFVKSVELLDTLVFSIPEWDGHSKYVTVWADSVHQVWTPLEVSPNDSLLYVTKSIFGPYEPVNTVMSIFRYEIGTDIKPESMGSLYIDIIHN